MVLKIGTAGVPYSSKEGSTLSGVSRVSELGLGAMEIEWVRGVRMKEEYAKEINSSAKKLGVRLTAHGPYWINLNSNDSDKLEKSKQRVLRTIRKGHLCGCKSITFHPAYYLKQDPSKVYLRLKKILRDINDTVRNEGIDLRISLETTGKVSQFGTFDEILKLSEEIEGIWPCIDFAHLYARSKGKMNSYEVFREKLNKMEEKLGREAIKNMHIHLSGIEYGKSGETRHRRIEDSGFEYKEVLKVLKEFNAGGSLICESPNPQDDALLIKKVYLLL